MIDVLKKAWKWIRDSFTWVWGAVGIAMALFLVLWGMERVKGHAKRAQVHKSRKDMMERTGERMEENKKQIEKVHKKYVKHAMKSYEVKEKTEKALETLEQRKGKDSVKKLRNKFNSL